MNKTQWDRRLEADAAINEAFPNGGLLIPIKDAAEFLGVTVKAMKSDKGLPIKKIGGRYFVIRKELARWISSAT